MKLYHWYIFIPNTGKKNLLLLTSKSNYKILQVNIIFELFSNPYLVNQIINQFYTC